MIWKACIALSLALCVVRCRNLAASEQHVEQKIAGHHGDLSHIGHQKPEHHEAYAWAYPSYEFSYTVDDPHTHDKKGQHEVRDGDEVSGKYWLIQPDGEKRYIRYHVDDESGFTAVINYTSPHSKVYYNVMKHRKEDDQSENGNKEDQEKEEGSQQKEGSQEDNINEPESDTKIEDGDRKEISDFHEQNGCNDAGHDEESRKQEQEKNGGEETRRFDDRRSWGWSYKRENDYSHEESRKNGKGSSQKSIDDEQEGIQQDNREDERNGSRDIGRDGDENKVQAEQRVHEGQQNARQSDNRLGNGKRKNQGKQNLWVILDSWTIKHDRPESPEKAVWEWNEEQYHSWPGNYGWIEERRQEEHRGAEKGRGGEERRDGEERKSAGERTGSEKRREEQIRGGEEGKERRGREDSRGQENRGGGNKRSGEDRSGRDQWRGGEQSRGGEQRRGVEQRRSGEERRGGEQRRGGESQDQRNRRGQTSYIVNYTPIPYGKRY